MTVYQKFRKLDMDPAVIGLQRDDGQPTYFCTPRGARVIGWAGVDGIHYCFIRGFGEMVFAVSPMRTMGDHVHPIARSFKDLLRLLIACGSMDALEQAHDFDENTFQAYCAQNLPSAEQAAAFGILRDKLHITPMEEPYAYIRQLQRSFDYGSIPYPPEYYDPEMNLDAEPKQPAWKVTYDGGFFPRRGRPGREIPTEKHFLWGENRWTIPAVYCCGKGMVVDFCMEVPPEQFTAFLEKWDLLHENEHAYTEDEQEQMEEENPLNVEFRPVLTVNGKALQQEHGCGCTWIAPACLPEGIRAEKETAWLLEHYGLDPNRCWSIHRCSFLWATKQKPAIRTVALHMEQQPKNIPGIHFAAPAVGESIAFTHPVTGVEHTLTVLEYEAQELDAGHFPDPEMEYPTHCFAMTYALSPDIPGQNYMLRDCAAGDSPRHKKPAGFFPAASVAVIGIIGGADGPTALFIGAPAKRHAAFSALHFEPVQNVEWRLTFREKTLPDLDITVL